MTLKKTYILLFLTW